MRLIPGNAQHIGSRQQQQDAFGFSNLADVAFRKHGGILAVVADGMGGMAHGDAASKIALKTFLEAYASKAETEPIPAALLRSLHSANAAVFQLALQMGSAEDMGTTLIAAALRQDHLYWISAGDSGIFLYRDGEFTQVNEAHIFGVDLDEKVSQGIISREDALAHPERESLTSFLGMEQVPLIDRNIRPFTLREEDVLLLASDGLFKTVPFAEMAQAMDGDAQQISEALVSRTLAAQRQHQDNVTVIAIRAEKERPSIALPPPPTPVAQRAAAAPAPRNWLRIALLVIAVSVACAYGYYMLAHDPSPKRKQQEVKKAPAAEGPGREGPAFSKEASPPLDRQPEQKVPPAAAPAPPQGELPETPPAEESQKTPLQERKP